MTLEHPTPSAGDIGEPEPVADVDPDRHYEQRVEPAVIVESPAGEGGEP